MRVFISGGCKNGKSFFAQRLAKAAADNGSGCFVPLYYIATMRPVDAEDSERIARHRDERDGWGFITVEQPCRIEEILRKCDTSGSFLLDSLTALLADEMFPTDGEVDGGASSRVAAGLMQVLSEIDSIVIVSDYIYSDAAIFDSLTEAYRKSLAEIDRVAARLCDVVLEISYAGVIVHKGRELYEKRI